MEEDSGQLLDSDLDSSQSQFPSQADSSAAGSAGHPVKNYRSKSLPAPFFPPIPNFNGQPSSASTSSSAAAGDNSHKRTNSTRTSNEEDDDFVIIRDDRRRVAAAGQGIKHSKLRDQELSDSKKRSEWRTLQQHYYPEGGWGWVVTLCALCTHALTLGSQLYLSNVVFQRFGRGWLGSVSMGISLFLSPIWVSICKRKSTRLAAVFGGLIASLGCLFTSFASQYHQLFFSYGAFLGVGVGLTRDASSLMVGQYFKRKREIVEIIVVAGSGLGIVTMSASIYTAINYFGWRLGLQAVTGTIFITFFLGTCYRSASLYHPQRRAILHLKNQKRKVKDKEKRDDKPPFLDFSCLRSKTLQILLLSSAFIAFGINAPLFYLVRECRENGIVEFSMILIHIYLGSAWILGCAAFGLLGVQKNQECRVSKQYLCQMAGLICGISILSLTAVKGYNGLVIFAWVYGCSLGGYNYALKVYTYERVRARHFPRAWSFIQCSQAIPLAVGVPLIGYMNFRSNLKGGYILAAATVIIGSAILFLADVRKRRLSRRKSGKSSIKTCESALESAQSPKLRRLSFSFPAEQMSPNSKHDSGEVHHDEMVNGLEPSNHLKELTCISEEGLADIDFQDIYFEEWEEYFGADCITSCNKVENCLLSEYDPDYSALPEPRRVRRWSAARLPHNAHAAQLGIGATAAAVASGIAGVGAAAHHLAVPKYLPATPEGAAGSVGTHRAIPIFRNHYTRGGARRASQPRTISIIDEASG